MINTKDLRIGNLLQLHTGLILKVSDINETVFIADYEDFGYPSEDFAINPIPLSEDLLKQFGFESTYEEFDEERFPSVVEYWVIIDSVTRFEVDYSTTNGYTVNIANITTGNALIIKRNIETVHQLQNLFFAITGTELDFNKA